MTTEQAFFKVLEALARRNDDPKLREAISQIAGELVWLRGQVAMLQGEMEGLKLVIAGLREAIGQP